MHIIRAQEKTDIIYDESNSRIIDAYRERLFVAVIEKYASKLSVNNQELTRYPFEKVIVFNSW